MKTISRLLLLASAVSAAALCTAQKSATPVAAYYEAEGSVYYESTGCKPGTEVDFYSRPTGGAILYKETADANGMARVKLQGNAARPAFSLNVQQTHLALIHFNVNIF